MDDLLEASLNGALRLASIVVRSIVWIVLQAWEYCFEIVLWYVGWPICRIASLGHFPKQTLKQHQKATGISLFTVCLIGSIIPFLAAIWLTPWG